LIYPYFLLVVIFTGSQSLFPVSSGEMNGVGIEAAKSNFSFEDVQKTGVEIDTLSSVFGKYFTAESRLYISRNMGLKSTSNYPEATKGSISFGMFQYESRIKAINISSFKYFADKANNVISSLYRDTILQEDLMFTSKESNKEPHVKHNQVNDELIGGNKILAFNSEQKKSVKYKFRSGYANDIVSFEQTTSQFSSFSNPENSLAVVKENTLKSLAVPFSIDSDSTTIVNGVIPSGNLPPLVLLSGTTVNKSFKFNEKQKFEIDSSRKEKKYLADEIFTEYLNSNFDYRKLFIDRRVMIDSSIKNLIHFDGKEDQRVQYKKVDSFLRFEIAKHLIDSVESRKEFLNVLKVYNNSKKTKKVCIQVELPPNWMLNKTASGIIMATIDSVNRKLIPLRIMPDSRSVIDSVYSVKVSYYSASCDSLLFQDQFNVTIAPVKSWEIKTESETYILKAESNEIIDIPVKIINSGNINQKVDFSYKSTRALIVRDIGLSSVVIAPYTDTTVVFKVQLKNKSKVIHNTFIDFYFTAEGKKKKRIYFDFSRSSYDASSNRFDINKVNLTYGQRNFLTSNYTDFFQLNGTFYFKNNKSLKLGFSSNNLTQPSNSDRSWIQEQIINAKYESGNSMIFVDQGNKIGPFIINTLNTGIKHRFRKSEILLSGGIMKMVNGYHASYLHNYSLSDALKLKFGLVALDESDHKVVTFAPVFGTDFSTKSGHSTSSWFGLNNSVNKLTNIRSVGFGGQLLYQYRIKTLNINVNNNFSSKSFRSRISNGYNNINSIGWSATKKDQLLFVSRQYKFDPLINYNINLEELPGERSLLKLGVFYQRKVKQRFKIGFEYENGYLEKTSSSLPFGSIQYSFLSEVDMSFSKSFSTYFSVQPGYAKITLTGTESIPESTPILFVAVKAKYKHVKIDSRFNLGPDNFAQQTQYFLDGVFTERLNTNLTYVRSIYNKKIDLDLGIGNSRNLNLKENTLQISSSINFKILNVWDLKLSARLNTYSFEDFFNNNDPTALNPYAFDVSLKRCVKGILQSHKLSDLSFKLFKDINSNGVKDQGEDNISNITVQLTPVEVDDKYIKVMLLNTDSKGSVEFLNLPEGLYEITVLTASTKDGFISTTLWNETNVIELGSNKHVEIPFKKGFLVEGKLSIELAKYTQFTNVSAAKTRVIVKSKKGIEYYALTDEDGGFRVSIPFDEEYNVTVRDVFGNKFEIPTQKLILNKTSRNKVTVNLVVKEKPRKINFR